MIKYIKYYLLAFLLVTGSVACSEDEGAQILGALHEKVDIEPEPGMNLVGRVTDGKNPIEGVVVSDGFAEIMPDYCILLVSSAERPDEIDRARAERAKERAEERLRQKQSIREYHLSKAALARAMARLKATR